MDEQLTPEELEQIEMDAKHDNEEEAIETGLQVYEKI